MVKRKEALTVIRKLTELGERSSRDSLYQRRKHSNVDGGRKKSSISGAWEGLLIGILTTQQRSTGRSNLVRQVMRSGCLSWGRVAKQPDLITKQVKGFNHNQRKRDYLRGAAAWLKANWREVRRHQEQILAVPVSSWSERYRVEREASEFIAEGVKGIGPKQARNFWQYRGYSVWTIPLDSRIKGILESEPFEVDTEKPYEDVEGAILTLCRDANTYPCLLDASLFDLDGLLRGFVGLPTA